MYESLNMPGYILRPRSQWPRGLRRGSAAVRLLGLCVQIPPGTWMSVCYECCVLSGRGLCVGLITRPEKSYRGWCAWVWSWSLDNEEALAHWALRLGLAPLEKKYIYIYILRRCWWLAPYSIHDSMTAERRIPKDVERMSIEGVAAMPIF
jgi:hypothetical protein